MATEKQIKARTRNWQIRQLRAYYHLMPPCVRPEARKRIHEIIDKELEEIFEAEPESGKIDRQIAKREKEENERKEIPF